MIYLEDVKPQCGAMFAWPGSHRAVHRYFCQKPHLIQSGGRVGGAGARAERPVGPHAALREECGYDEAPVEVTMQAGDALFWHHFLVHNSSMNASRQTRQGLIARWYAHRRQVVSRVYRAHLCRCFMLFFADTCGAISSFSLHLKAVHACVPGLRRHTTRLAFGKGEDIAGIRSGGGLWKWWAPALSVDAACCGREEVETAAGAKL